MLYFTALAIRPPGLTAIPIGMIKSASIRMGQIHRRGLAPGTGKAWSVLMQIVPTGGKVD